MMDGQITISDYLATKIMKRDVMDLTCWINNQGKCQFDQISDDIGTGNTNMILVIDMSLIVSFGRSKHGEEHIRTI